MRYFFPDWEDKVDPGYQFADDRFSPDRIPYWDDKYAHEVLGIAPYDGLLVSKSLLEAKPGRKVKILDNGGIREHLHIGDERYSDLIVMGDCGAFSYVNEETVPEAYQPVELVEFYGRFGFDWGVAPDHLVVSTIRRMGQDGKLEQHVLSLEEKKARRDESLKNAKLFIQAWERAGADFEPVATAQGWDEESYVDSCLSLHAMGYKRIALGAMVRKPSQYILGVLRALNREVERKGLGRRGDLPFQLHLMGIGRLDIIEELFTLGVTSFDSRSHYRNAWTRETQNYLTPEGKWYAAIRVPQSDHYQMSRAAAQEGVLRHELEQMEEAALDALRRYEKRELSLDETVGRVLRYDHILFRDGVDGKLDSMYPKTLSDRPWELCSCPICKELGIEVIIFRGGNRNRRRGFHNMWIFYNLLQEKLSALDVSPPCTPSARFHI
jgi:hypothetical protein